MECSQRSPMHDRTKDFNSRKKLRIVLTWLSHPEFVLTFKEGIVVLRVRTYYHSSLKRTVFQRCLSLSSPTTEPSCRWLELALRGLASISIQELSWDDLHYCSPCILLETLLVQQEISGCTVYLYFLLLLSTNLSILKQQYFQKGYLLSVLRVMEPDLNSWQ